MACVYLRAGRSVSESLQALEQYRGVISSLIIDSRSDVSLLEERYPEVAARYCALRQEVASQGFFNEQGVMQYERKARLSKSLKLAQGLEILENMEVERRELPDFFRFQLPPTEDTCSNYRDIIPSFASF